MTTRTRIAPSPTGFAHVGTAYASLFNFAFARHVKGKFIIRLEDTDVKRHVAGAEEALYEGLRWLGFTWDEGPDKGGPHKPYRQSERLSLYKKKAQELVKGGVVYEKEGALYFKSPAREVSWNDAVRGEITFPADSTQLKDFVILKSDGYPTYNFAVVVDDIAMEISHVIRAEEHISNTPRQLLLYGAFGKEPPVFAHIPALRNPQRAKLSKRRDPVDLRFYRDEGYLPEALVNFLCLLGWSHPEEKEIFSLEEFVKVFDLSRVRKAGPIFDMTKLAWINGEYIREAKNEELKAKIWEYLDRKYPADLIEKTIPLVKERIKTLKEYEDFAGFFFEEPKLDKKLFSGDAKKHLEVALDVVDRWDENLQSAFLSAIEQNKFKISDFFMSLRVAITGSKITPPIVPSIVILGKEKTVSRIKNAIELIS
ncbi:glutamate--tRNA ligase [Candidatus Microgenomates bacterium]|nr:glutamate--tRNA ligase [Candidatus Microgenomates bacterium]